MRVETVSPARRRLRNVWWFLWRASIGALAFHLIFPGPFMESALCGGISGILVTALITDLFNARKKKKHRSVVCYDD